MEKFVITINRQFGSMGRPIAREMAQQLNVEFYDRDIIEATAQKLNMSLSIASDLEESAARPRFWNMCFPLGRGESKKQDEIFQVQKQIILDIADGQSCIIVGRCSDYILRCTKHVLRVFIYAPYRKRLENCIERLKMDEDTAKAMIRQVDRARDAYQMRYAHYLPGDFHYNDLMIDSSILGVENTAQYLTELIVKKFSSRNISD
ncbi:AAA family ATPase [uncultured Megasphaera sp.]|uniref:cytidylate kinase-like family protein n=1 Tax=uncultured Megasphaera sp. TaxID=165188 RepID=UPI00265967B9|nr:cytidylate kinase-like family protein [uncultured Megasphaera sp.]